MTQLGEKQQDFTESDPAFSLIITSFVYFCMCKLIRNTAMKQIVFLSLGIAALLCSCSRSLTDVGYSSFSELQYNTLSAKTDGRDYFSPLRGVEVFPYRPTALKYKLYNYVTDNDIEHLYDSKIAMRLQLLSEFYSQFGVQNFNLGKINKEYMALMSPQVRESAESYSLKDNSPLGIWQIFKPYPGLDVTATKYEISYKGNDWFSVRPKGDVTEVRLRILLAGKHLQPVVAEIENPSFGITVDRGLGSDIGRGYAIKGDWENYTEAPYRRSESYNKFLASIVYKQCTSKTKVNYVTEKDILLFADKLVDERKAFLRDMYALLSSEPDADNNSKFEKICDETVSVPIRDALKEIHSANNKDRSKGIWKPIEPRDKNNCQIAYDKNNWFKIDEAATDSLCLQVVFYGRKLYPLITGICNKDYNLLIQQDYESNRSMSPGFGL